MIQLRVLSESGKSTLHRVTHFPCVIGRANSARLRLEEPGVWEQHLELDLDGSHRFMLKVFPHAFAVLNRLTVQTATLRNGDVIEIGSLQIHFWLSETRQKALRLRECLTWALLAAVSWAQVGLIYWLLS